MVRKKTPEPGPPRRELLISIEEASEKIQQRIDLGRELLACQIRNQQDFSTLKDNYTKWHDYNKEMLDRCFTSPTLSKEYAKYDGTMSVRLRAYSLREEFEELQKVLGKKVQRLESLQERLELIPLAVGVSVGKSATASCPIGKRVFVVHGHDTGTLEMVARFIEKLDLEPTILHEQVTGGRTIIEKLEFYSDVDFAVIILTPDDIGAVKTDPRNLKPRARQNVILELGYFAGKLGRERVCALYSSGIELPSDYMGVGYVPLDGPKDWKVELAKELREVGFPIDMNKVF